MMWSRGDPQGERQSHRLGEGMKYTGNCVRDSKDCETEGSEGEEVTAFCSLLMLAKY